MFLGIAISLRAVAHWESVHFGKLYPPEVLREVIPALVSVTSFFLSVLSFKCRKW
jgi:hypothetical protein